ncbi:hypothetical protein DPMN_040331 [Dreissena polymorpha]|uniref:Uncharacterized protein n=1 Tax=Dreissena polymorpha TaxID=45954 RepID=A0A9D4CV32_DREPO|nr:hypothetical protein DPMN_040331 [Dreissena polymorpha]
MFFNKPQAINTTNLRTKFHDDWAINVSSRVLTSKAAPPPGGHIFQQTKTIFKFTLAIIKTNVQTKFHEDWTINVLTSKTALPPGGHVFLPIRTIFKLNRRIQETNVLTKFHKDWTKNVTSRAFTCFHYIHIEKTVPPPGGHIFHWTETIFELNQHIIKTNILTNFELGRGIIGTNVQTKFHEDRTINVASKVFTRQIELRTNVQTKFHEDWTINVTPRVLTSKTALPPGGNRKLPRLPGGHVFSPIWTIFELVQDINKTNVLIKFHDAWAKIVTSRVNTAPPPGGHVFQRTETIFDLNQYIIKTNNLTNFELGRGIIGKNVLTKFHEDRTINVASRVFTRQMLTTDARRTTHDGQKATTKAHHEHFVLR